MVVVAKCLRVEVDQRGEKQEETISDAMEEGGTTKITPFVRKKACASLGIECVDSFFEPTYLLGEPQGCPLFLHETQQIYTIEGLEVLKAKDFEDGR